MQNTNTRKRRKSREKEWLKILLYGQGFIKRYCDGLAKQGLRVRRMPAQMTDIVNNQKLPTPVKVTTLVIVGATQESDLPDIVRSMLRWNQVRIELGFCGKWLDVLSPQGDNIEISAPW